jgi:hypothetical protein
VQPKDDTNALDSREIVMQESRGECGHVGLINLLLARGVKAPTVEFIKRCSREMRAGLIDALAAQSPDELTPLEAFHILGGMNKFLCLMGLIPPVFWKAPAPILKHYLDIGCHLLLFYRWRYWTGEGTETLRHIVVAEGYADEGYKVLDGDGPFEDEELPLERKELTEREIADALRWRQICPRGARRTLPFCEVSMKPHEPGLLPQFVIIYPGGFEEGAEFDAFFNSLVVETVAAERTTA